MSERDIEALGLPNDREQGLSQNFEDPNLAELIPGLTDEPATPSVMQEAVEAVHELVVDAQAEPALDLAMDLPTPAEPAQPFLAADAQALFAEPAAATSADRWSMAQRLFDLVVCERPFHELVEQVLLALMQAVRAEAGSVLELDHEKKEYFFRATVGGSAAEKVKAFRVPINKGIVGHVGQSRQFAMLSDPEADQMQLRAISLSVGFEARTCLAAPFLVGNELYGVVELFNRQDGQPFDDHDLQALEEGMKMAAKVLEVRFLMAEFARRKG